ncbi:type II 3-dehydroquinate dehydratase [Dethiosulfatarculus sandiegensis]|uniref:3-dehydroquinate dehydratase n=1 Tax=Dethiosulfatarculus sandiegensis TaxID=1429043 RepID=A0A0D2J3N3_9BACT|nr:type II 3-dehydroquinate dehydratase [Dethiosulfatarculus sandiegensis]KIX12799.1 3-dehydroquinate dehydratase [Dethiosulfatarculus sandiegensis]
MKFTVVNGPNLNLLGLREPDLYGSLTLKQINQRLEQRASELGVELVFFQSNHEGDLVDALQKAGKETQGVILNAAAYTHTSVALRDAILCLEIPVIEVHLTNPQAREEFRQKSLIAAVCQGTVAGFGGASYLMALDWLALYKRE